MSTTPNRAAFAHAYSSLCNLANGGPAMAMPSEYERIVSDYVAALEAELEAARRIEGDFTFVVRDQAAAATESNAEIKRLEVELTRYRERVALLVSRLERLEVLHSAMAGVLRTKHTSIPPAPAELLYNGANVSSHDREQALEVARLMSIETPTAWERALHADARRDPEGVAAWHSIVARHDRDLAAQRERAAVLEFLAREARSAEASNGAQADCIRALWLAVDAGEHLAKRPLEPGERA